MTELVPWGKALLVVATLAGALLALGTLVPPRARRGRFLPVLVDASRATAASGARAAGCVALLAWLSAVSNGLVRYPYPTVNDEWANLLIGDTFASGRLANPTSPLWRHFETVAVFHTPSYAGKHPPLLGAVLAFGEAVFGHPWWGMTFAMAGAAAAVCWALRAWIGPRAALVAGLLVALHPVMQHFQRFDFERSNYSWSHSYWGGALAMLGGALVIGAVGRWARRPLARHAAVGALGAAVLAMTRPFEGLVLCALTGGWLLVRARTTAARWAASAAVVLAVMAPVAGFNLAYNQAVTGSPFTFPHAHYAELYGVASELLVLPAEEPPASWGNDAMRSFYEGWIGPTWESQRASLGGYWRVKRTDLEKWSWFYVQPFWLLLLVGAFTLRRRRGRVLLAWGLVPVLLGTVSFRFHPHYAAPFAPALMGFIALGARRLSRMRSLPRLSRPGSLPGPPLAKLRLPWPVFPAIACVLVLVPLGTRVVTMPAVDPGPAAPGFWDWAWARQRVVEELERTPGRHLVVVRYGPDHDFLEEWVHNGADLEGGKIVWARDLSGGSAALLEAYEDRRVWVLYPDERPRRLLAVGEADGEVASVPGG